MKPSKEKLFVFRAVGGMFILVGCLVMVVGLVWMGMTSAFVMRAAKAPGTVIEMERSASSHGGSTYSPIFKFTDQSGIVHTQRSSWGDSTYTFEPGENVTVLYDPASPKNSKIDSFRAVWFGPLFLTIFGLVFGGFACFWLFLAEKSGKL